MSSTVSRKDRGMGNELLFVYVEELYTDKAASLFANAVVAHPLHIVLLNFTHNFCRYVHDHGFTISELLPASIFHADQDKPEEALDGIPESLLRGVNSSDVFPGSMGRDTQTVKLRDLYKARQRNVQDWNDCVQLGFSVALCEITWKCLAVIFTVVIGQTERLSLM